MLLAIGHSPGWGNAVPLPLFGAVAQTARGRQRLTPEYLHQWTRRWVTAPVPADWWIDKGAGVALFRPEIVLDRADGHQAVLGIRGVVVAGGRREPPDGWPGVAHPTGAHTVLYDLLDRDTAAVAALRGQFSLAFWDGRRRRLMLGRDHLGQRGVFVHRDSDTLVFCSELAPLLGAAQSPCTLDPEGALWYLAFGMPPLGRTLAAGVDRLPAAHVLWWEPGHPPVEQRYWTPLDPEAPRDAGPETVTAIRSALDRAVSRAVSGRPEPGLLLSGGVDSTYLAVTAATLGCRPRAFTAEFVPGYGMNETEYATAVAEWLGLHLSVVTLSPGQAAQVLEEVVLPAAEPCAAWATMTYDSVLAAARGAGVDAVLSGLGADEIFGGYDHFRGYYSRLIRYQRRHARPAGSGPLEALMMTETQAARRVLYPGIARFFDDPSLRSAMTSGFRDWHYASRLRAFYRECLRLKPDAHAMELMVAHECQHRIPDLLHANFEPIVRQFGMEMHYPFLDPDVVRLVAGLSVESRYRTRTGQFLSGVRHYIPDSNMRCYRSRPTGFPSRSGNDPVSL